MAKIKVITLTPEAQSALEHGFRTSPSAAFRQRCQIILFKSQRRSALAVAGIVGYCGLLRSGRQQLADSV